MPDDKWSKYAVPAAGAAEDKWAKYAAPTEKVETPDPTKPAAGLSKTPLPEELKTPTLTERALLPSIPGTHGAPSYLPVGKGQAKEVEKRRLEESLAGAKSGAKFGFETTGAMLGGGATAGIGRGILPFIMRALATGTGGALGNYAISHDPTEALKTGGTFAALEGVGAGGKGIWSKLGPKIEPLAKINKLLGVGEAELIPGKTPASLDEFVANPARGASKYGLTEKTLAKMNPIERNAAVMAARDKAGQSLDAVLKQASDSGKTVNVQEVIKDVFGQITDKKVAAKVQDKILDIVARNGINKPLSRLTPSEARSIQRALDKFADFAPSDTAESMKQAATQLRKGISQATRKAVPESAEFDQDYTDLVNASQATQKLVKDFATKVPADKLREWIIKTAIGGTVAGLGYEAGKHFTTPVP